MSKYYEAIRRPSLPITDIIVEEMSESGYSEPTYADSSIADHRYENDYDYPKEPMKSTPSTTISSIAVTLPPIPYLHSCKLIGTSWIEKRKKWKIALVLSCIPFLLLPIYQLIMIIIIKKNDSSHPAVDIKNKDFFAIVSVFVGLQLCVTFIIFFIIGMIGVFDRRKWFLAAFMIYMWIESVILATSAAFELIANYRSRAGTAAILMLICLILAFQLRIHYVRLKACRACY